MKSIRALILLLAILLLVPMAFAEDSTNTIGQWNLTGAGYSLLPGPNSRVEPFMQTGVWYKTPYGTYTITFIDYRKDVATDVETFGLGTVTAVPIWKLLIGGGANAVKYDKGDDALPAGEFFAVTGIVSFLPSGIEKSQWGLSGGIQYITRIQKASFFLGLSITPH